MKSYTTLLFTLLNCYINVNAKNIITQSAGREASFFENKGQLTDQYGNARTDINYKLSGNDGLNMFIGNGSIHYQFCSIINKGNETNHVLPLNGIANPLLERIFNMYRLDVELTGANKNARILSEGQSEDYEIYYTTALNGHAAVVKGFNKITYKDIYPNIDWVLSSDKGTIKQEFVLRQGARESDIRIKYYGANALSINTQGALEVSTPMGMITEDAPYCYDEEGHTIKSEYKLEGNTMTYQIGDHNGNVVIDPNLVWATYYGGISGEAGYSVCTNTAGDIFMTGSASSTNNIATTGAYQQTYQGNGDAFVVKFDAGGQRIWATYYGGTYFDCGNAVCTDNSGNVIIAGSTASPTSIASAGAYQTSFAGLTDAFLVKLDNAGFRIWGTYLGGANDDYTQCLATDPAGNIYMGGYTKSNSGIATAGAHQTTYGGNSSSDGFLAKFDENGAILWSSYYGGSGNDDVSSLTLDDTGNVLICGTTGSTNNIATIGAFQPAPGGGIEDGYIAKFNSNGVRKWGTYYGGIKNDELKGIANAGNGSIYVGGYSESTSGLTTPSAFMPDTPYAFVVGNGILAKFDGTGTLTWGTYYGGMGYDEIVAVTSDSVHNLYALGYTGTSNALNSGLATPGAYQMDIGGAKDAIVVEFNSSGQRRWASYYGGPDYDPPYSIAIYDTSNVYITGYTLSQTGIATNGAFQTIYAGTDNAFLAKFCSPVPDIGAISGQTVICIGTPDTLTESIQGGTWSIVVGHANIDANGIAHGITQGFDTVIYTVSGMCGMASTSVPIYVDPAPTPTIYQNGMTLTTGFYGSYQWYLNGNPIPNANMDTYIATTAGTYYVQVWDFNGCMGTSPTTTVWNVHAPEINNNHEAISIYPNPASDILNIDYSDIKKGHIIIYDLTGRIAIEQELNHKLDIHTLEKGLYTYTISGSNISKVCGKMVKK